MPILPGETHRKIKQRQLERLSIPDRMGEEGMLHLILIGEEQYFAKQWHTIAEKRRTMSLEAEGSPASPYWHKVKKYEADLVKAALPEYTVRVVASYDPRIRRDDAGEYHFAYQTGRPVTITPEVKADPQLMQQRDASVLPTYDMMFRYHQETEHGAYATVDQRAEFYRVIAESDDKMQQLFGEENVALFLAAQQPFGQVTLDTAKQIADQTVLTKPNTPLSRLWKNGILAIHPHFNFIPEGKTSDGKVKGKYLEVAIFDLERYWQQLRLNRGDRGAEAMVGAIERYQLVRALDALFDDLINQDYGDRSNLVHQAEVQTALFRCTEAVRQRCEQYSTEIIRQIYHPILNEVRLIIKQATNVAMAQRGIAELTQRITHLSVEYRRA